MRPRRESYQVPAPASGFLHETMTPRVAEQQRGQWNATSLTWRSPDHRVTYTPL